MITSNNGTPQSPAAPASSSNGVHPGTLSGRAILANLLAPKEQPVSTAIDSSNPPPAQGDPENPHQPTAAEEPGQENILTSEDGTATEALAEAPEGAEAEATGAAGISQKFNEVLGGLNEDAQRHLLKMVEGVAKGEVNLGELTRNFKFSEKENHELNRLRKEVEALRGQRTEAANGPVPMAPVHSSVAGVKSEADAAKVQQFYKELKRWCGRNPQGGTFQTSVGGQAVQVEAEQVNQYQDLAEDVLDTHLPQQVAQLRAAGEFTQRQQAARELTRKNFPVLEDDENPDTQMARQIMRDPGLANQVEADYIALCVARGHRELQTELARRAQGASPSGKTSNGKATVAVPGKVPVGKPHSGPNGSVAAAPRVNQQQSVQTALKIARETGSRVGLANVLSSMRSA